MGPAARLGPCLDVGLAVVADLVASHHGELKLGAADAGGARVAITLPPP
jgi:two-component system sensor histidine kinase PhoQ